MKISLIDIRCFNIEDSKIFYEKLGLSFVQEQHGNGPIHYSCEHDDCVFELYPNNGEMPKDNNRLGFKVLNMENVMKNLNVSGSYELDGKIINIVIDPDGRKIEISE